ncbi:hypothetical protein AB0D49_29110 [Streptomyces sp. NPDC048290]|uniref:hypothetical protein n=1 Tax=Streptomyces sp. NPDC048290 TaxID=3155811 RepID=UPI003423C65B
MTSPVPGWLGTQETEFDPETLAYRVIRRLPVTGRLVDISHNFPPSPDRARYLSYARDFETALSLAILDYPGRVGEVYDRFSRRLATVLEGIYTDAAIGNQRVCRTQADPAIETLDAPVETLREVVTRGVLMQMSPLTDQIGRWRDDAAEQTMRGLNDSADQRHYMETQGLQWLLAELRTPTTDDNYRYDRLLTKIKAICGFGSLVWQYLQEPYQFQDMLVRRDGETFTVNTGEAFRSALRRGNPDIALGQRLEWRFRDFRSRTRTPLFDQEISRARIERVPELLHDAPSGTWRYIEASSVNKGFGSIIDVVDPGLRQQLQAQEEEMGVGGLPRIGQPITDLSRPGTLSDADARLENMPRPFQDSGLPDALADHRYFHGTGTGRWQLRGTWMWDAEGQLLPVAGAQSGGTCDILLGLSCLSPTSLYGDRDTVLAATTGIAAYMNFGAYHTFVSTFPIGQCMAEGVMGNEHTSGYRPFVPYVDQRRARSLYQQVRQSVIEFADSPAGAMANQNWQAYWELTHTGMEQARSSDLGLIWHLGPRAFDAALTEALPFYDTRPEENDDPPRRADHAPPAERLDAAAGADGPAQTPGAPLLPDLPPPHEWDIPGPSWR